MAINKVVFGNDTLIDITDTTATASDVQHDKYFYDASGVKVQGTYVPQSIELAAGSADPSESAQHITPPSGYDGFEYFDVGAVSSDYVGSNIAQRSSSDLTASGSVVTIPSGYYAAEVSKAINAGSATTPSAILNWNPTITVNDNGLITASYSAHQDITPNVVPGYINSGTAGRVTATGSSSKQLSTQETSTINPTESSQVAVASGKFTTGPVTVAAIPSDYIGSAIASVEVVEGVTTVSGSSASRGMATWSAGVIASGSIEAATFANSSSGQTQYVDISNTTEAPVLVSGGYLYINKGYTDNLKISLAKLVPDGANADLSSDKILSGYAAYDNDGNLIAGNILSKSASIYYTSSSDQIIEYGKYLSGNQTIKAVQTSGITAANVKDGVVVKVGDVGDDDRIIGITGTFTDASTVSDGQVAAAAGQILDGYSAWVDGEEVQGTIAAKSSTDVTVAGPTVSVPSGYYNADVNKTITSGTLNEMIPLSPIDPDWALDGSTGIISVDYGAAPGIQPIATSGYFNTGEYIYPMITMNSSYQLSTQSAATYTPSSSTQTIPSGVYLTGVQTIEGDVNLIAENIAEGVTIFGITGTHHGGPIIWRWVLDDYLIYMDRASVTDQRLITPGVIAGTKLTL